MRIEKMNTHWLSQKLLWQLLIFMGALILIITIVARGVNISSASQGSPAYPAPGMSWHNEATQIGQSTCDRLYTQEKNLNLPSEKRLMNEAEYQSCLKALTAIPDIKQKKLIESPMPTTNVKEMRARKAAGAGIIIFGVVVRGSPATFSQTNTWYERKGDEYIYVFGGANRVPAGSQDTSEGAVIVDKLSLNHEFLPGGGVYPTPIKAGPVTIVDANGELLTLSTQDGHVFFFDVASRQYTQAQGPTKLQAGNGAMIEMGLSPFSTQPYTFQNQWFHEANGNRITVYVGQENVPNGRGVVMTVISKGEPTASDVPQVYLIPGAGTLWRIFDVNGERLTLVAKWGETRTFDLNTKQISEPILIYISTDPRLATLEAPPQITPAPKATLMSKPNATATPLQAYP